MICIYKFEPVSHSLSFLVVLLFLQIQDFKLSQPVLLKPLPCVLHVIKLDVVHVCLQNILAHIKHCYIVLTTSHVHVMCVCVCVCKKLRDRLPRVAPTVPKRCGLQECISLHHLQVDPPFRH